MDPQDQRDPQYQTVLEEIAGRLGPGDGKPFADVNPLHGLLWRPETGGWRLYQGSDYLEGSWAVVGSMRELPNGDHLLWVQMGASLVRYEDGAKTTITTYSKSSSWH